MNDMIELAKKFGTPLYLMFEEEILKSCEKFKSSVEKSFGKNAMILYASKALSCVGLLKIIKNQNLGLDVSSGGELFTAIKAGFPMDRVTFHGNNKSEDELKMAIEYSVSRIVIDNNEEFENLLNLSKKYNRKINILFRINPEVDANTHKSVNTGKVDSKFGITFDQARENIRKIFEQNLVIFKGFHSHIGSQIFDCKDFQKEAETMVRFCSDIKNEFGFEPEELNLGGGFGVKYTDDNPEIDIEDFIFSICLVLKKECDRNRIKMPFVYFEPGRSIVAKAGVTLYTVGCVKKTKNKTYVIVDGSMNDNPRFVLYGSKYRIENISEKNKNSNFEEVVLSGRCCESGDIISDSCFLKNPKRGDIIAVYCTGAYNFSMSSNYNKIPKPPIVLVTKNGEAKVIVRRQSYEDLISCEID